MGLNANQKKAVEYLDGPLLVLAGPGTGKTQLLSSKVAYILKNTDTNPENILCMTFTDSGASNMRDRLKSIIGNDGAKVQIGTYHSFGSELLSRYKNYSEDYNRKLNSPIDDIKRYTIVKGLQERLDGRDILRGDRVSDIINVISAAKSAGLTPDDLEIIAKKNMEDSEVLSQAISPLLLKVVPRKFQPSFDAAFKPIYEMLKEYTEAGIIVKNIERSIGVMARDLKEAMVTAEGSGMIGPLTAWRDSYFEKDGKGNYRLKDRVANKKLFSVASLMRSYNDYLFENGLYDFDDMILEALRILQTDAGFKATLSEQYQFILLDEFQDTNPSQFAIIKELTDYEKPMIMAVGDDDQAIYEFQGALSTNLTDFQRHYQANVISLVENYRSTQEILDFSHHIIAQADDRFADKELIAHKKNPSESQIYRHEFLSSDMEYAFIADKIRELIEKGVSQNEIAIISRKTKYFMPLLPFLKAKPEIKIAYEKRDNLLEDERMHEIFTMARFVYEIANEKRVSVPILEVMSYPFFGLPMFEVVKAAERAHTDKKSVFEALLSCENSKIHEVMNFFANLVAVSFTEPLEIFIDYLIGASELKGYRSPYLSYYAKKEYDAFTLYENLASLRGKLKAHFDDKALKLADLIAMLDEYMDAEMPITVVSPYRDADEAVSILTAHKAKGLEFEYVFIIAADGSAWGKGKGNNSLLTLPKNLTQIRHTGITEGERLRILYVALTRAKHTLYITNSVHDFNGKSPKRLEYFEEYEDDGLLILPFLPSRRVIVHDQPTAQELAENTRQSWVIPYLKSDPDMRSLYKERISHWRMSASSLTSYIDIVYAGPEAFFKSYILRAPREPETEALAYGDLVHKTFEAVTNQQLSDEKAVEFFLTELDKKELPVEIESKLREKGPLDIAVSLKAFGEILRAGKAEVDLGPEKISVDGVPITGKIDHVLVNEDEKTIEIYDFKTGGYHTERWRSHATLFKYMLQLCFYKMLLNNSPTYMKYKVTGAHILFVTPDKDGEVYDKLYEYNNVDEKLLRELIVAVYNQVSDLSFIDDDDLMVQANNTLGIKDIKAFIELVLAK